MNTYTEKLELLDELQETISECLENPFDELCQALSKKELCENLVYIARMWDLDYPDTLEKW